MMKAQKPKQAPCEPREGSCAAYITHKGRYCKFSTLATGKFCGFHSDDASRIACPVDGAHSIFKVDLKSHVKKCPSKAAEPASYIHFQCNVSLQDETSLDLMDLRTMDPSIIMEVMDIAARVVDMTHIVDGVKQHEVMDDRISNEMKLKHAYQQSSLIGHLDDAGLLHASSLFIEWGAGRAELSRYVNKALLSRSPLQHKMLLIDRGSARHKEDHRIVQDSIAADIPESVAQSITYRVKADIADINLDELLSVAFGDSCSQTASSPKICSISKHLCGAATDLTLSCLDASKANHVGLLIALCCHQKCAFSALHPVSRNFLIDHGIDAPRFRVLTALSSWTVNGLRKDMDGEDSRNHWSTKNHSERQRIGWNCKRLIDVARCAAVESMGYRVNLIRYTTETRSPECVALLGITNSRLVHSD